jgi:hypothetical protein
MKLAAGTLFGAPLIIPDVYCIRMGSPASVAAKSTCRFIKDDGEPCRRVVALPETKCWQHASSLKHKWKSLTKNQSVAFVLVLLGLVLTILLGVPSLYYAYRESHGARKVKPEVVTSPAPEPNPLSAPVNQEPQKHPPAKGSKSKEPPRVTDLGLHGTNETVTIPSNSKATFSYGKTQPGDLETLDRMDKDYKDAKGRLDHDPNKLVLHDLFLTDFSSIINTSSLLSGMTVKNGETGALTHVEYMVVRQLETGTKFLEFYVLYTEETERICESLANLYQNALNDFLEGRVEAEKIPGDSEVTTSSDLVFSNRVFIYHEAYLSPEQVITVRDAFKKKGVTVILRSTDYLSNKQLDAKVKLLEKKH